MRPLREWVPDATGLEMAAFCSRHPHPLLIHSTTGYQIRGIDRMAHTIDRAVLAPAVRPLTPPQAIDDYLALVVKAANGTRSFHLSVGATADCDIHINDVSISKVHAYISRDTYANWYVQDAGSTTGTHVNDRDQCETQALASGDRISFGMVDLTFLLPRQVYELVRKLVGHGGATRRGA